MELRLQFKQAIRIQVSNDCTLHALKQSLLQTLGSSLPPDSLHLSLDRNDNLEASSSLQSQGIHSGDLVFFTLNSIDSDLENLDPIGVVPKNCPKSILLSRVMKEHLRDGRNAHKLLVIAVHAVLLDSGLSPVDHSDIPEEWPSIPRTRISIRYTIGGPYANNEGVMLRFWSLINSVSVSESIDFLKGSEVYQFILDATTFGPNLDSIWANSMLRDRVIDEKEWNRIERKMCELWKEVKDGLVLPMFMLLPHGLMLKIVKSVSGVDIAKLQIVCKELRNLCNDKDLWRLKLHQEFPFTVDLVLEDEQCKKNFGLYYEDKMNMNMIAIQMEQDDQPPQPNVVYGDGYNVWQTYIMPAWYYDFGPNPFQYAYGPYYYWEGQNAYGPYYYWGGQNAYDPHQGWQGQGHNAFNPHHGVQGRGRGQNAFNPHHGWQGQGINVYYPHVQWQGLEQNAFNQHHGWQGQGLNVYYPHHGVQGRGRGQNAFDPHHGVQGQGRGQNAFDPHHGVQGRGQNAFYPHHGMQGQAGHYAFNPHHGVQGQGRGQNAFDPHHGWQGRGRG